MGSRPGHGNWDERYASDERQPWDIGGPQPAFAALIDQITIKEPVLDVGCGTGDLAIYIAAKGYSVVGIDCSPNAITTAQNKAAGQKLDVTFEVADAEHLESLSVKPRTVFDSGLLHSLDDAGQRAYTAGLMAICDPGAAVFVLSISTHAGMGWGVTRDRLNELFPVSHWAGTCIEITQVLAHIDGDARYLHALLMATRRVGR